MNLGLFSSMVALDSLRKARMVLCFLRRSFYPSSSKMLWDIKTLNFVALYDRSLYELFK